MPPTPRSPLQRVGRVVVRALVALGGGIAVLAGVAMLVLPGPGLVTIALGLSLLGREFRWAARLNASVTARIRRAAGRGAPPQIAPAPPTIPTPAPPAVRSAAPSRPGAPAPAGPAAPSGPTTAAFSALAA